MTKSRKKCDAAFKSTMALETLREEVHLKAYADGREAELVFGWISTMPDALTKL